MYLNTDWPRYLLDGGFCNNSCTNSPNWHSVYILSMVTPTFCVGRRPCIYSTAFKERKRQSPASGPEYFSTLIISVWTLNIWTELPRHSILLFSCLILSHIRSKYSDFRTILYALFWSWNIDYLLIVMEFNTGSIIFDMLPNERLPVAVTSFNGHSRLSEITSMDI